MSLRSQDGYEYMEGLIQSLQEENRALKEEFKGQFDLASELGEKNLGLWKTIDHLNKNIERYEVALKEITNPQTNTWSKYKEVHGNEISFQEFLKSIANDVLKKT